MNNNLRSIRLERGMSIAELSRRSGLSRFAISKIEKGESDPLSSSMKKISKVLGKKVEDIFFNHSVIQE